MEGEHTQELNLGCPALESKRLQINGVMVKMVIWCMDSTTLGTQTPFPAPEPQSGQWNVIWLIKRCLGAGRTNSVWTQPYKELPGNLLVDRVATSAELKIYKFAERSPTLHNPLRTLALQVHALTETFKTQGESRHCRGFRSVSWTHLGILWNTFLKNWKRYIAIKFRAWNRDLMTISYEGDFRYFEFSDQESGIPEAGSISGLQNLSRFQNRSRKKW